MVDRDPGKQDSKENRKKCHLLSIDPYYHIFFLRLYLKYFKSLRGLQSCPVHAHISWEPTLSHGLHQIHLPHPGVHDH